MSWRGRSVSRRFFGFFTRPARAEAYFAATAREGHVGGPAATYHSLCQLLRKGPGISAHLQGHRVPRLFANRGETAQWRLAERSDRRNVFDAGGTAALRALECGERQFLRHQKHFVD